MEKNNDINKSSFWEHRYEKGEIGWDLGAETPVFTAISEKLKPGKVCILGCGNGYDAISFSKKGFSVTAVDFAKTPINNLQIAARSLSLSIETIKKDIFDLIPDFSSQFDYIIEYNLIFLIIEANQSLFTNQSLIDESQFSSKF